MPSPLAPDPNRVQSRVFVVYSEPIEIALQKLLSLYLSHYPRLGFQKAQKKNLRVQIDEIFVS